MDSIKANSMNPYKLYEDLIDSSTCEMKSRLDVITLEQELLTLQSDFLHHMKFQEPKNVVDSQKNEE